MSTDARAVVAVLLTDRTRAMVLTPAAEGLLTAAARVRWAQGPPGEWDLRELLDGAVACLTGWGTPPITEQALANAPDLRLVAHTAGSIRALVPQDAVGGRLTVCQSAGLIADSVAELVIAQILSVLRDLPALDAGLRTRQGWGELRERHPGRLLGARTVGVVGASRTGRAVIGLLRAFGARVLVADPLLTTAEADDLGVTLVELDDLLRDSEVVTLHAPLLPRTEGLLGAGELALLADGALLVNAARGGLVDADALAAELRSGRIRAALDVFPTEPLAPDSPWRQVPNAILSPHTAGHTVDSHVRQGQAMVEDVVAFLRGEPPRYAVAADSVAVLA
ncbi:Phosphoglycerate dehydrogenase [Actinopolymorpha cephalotaxi]|uniref:Phosphoglycerate dehydrogenase n=1 Tax=Actinopolymorpha cephalotaxi TaxID=504797 RepID=A0A1I2KIF4_9ACTN|nr:hydroxyacid dehydrogenase [Actinopolymorpha cephalotaxi]NYH81208.1 phosphoglycerate dehydrogenase-like enzyme [Actinopolymorpha cephalotaxi]SFF66069.1 Phosphoglycerate dehydrogenase [Actinopolymorpha cephalotaxi]